MIKHMIFKSKERMALRNVIRKFMLAFRYNLIWEVVIVMLDTILWVLNVGDEPTFDMYKIILDSMKWTVRILLLGPFIDVIEFISEYLKCYKPEGKEKKEGDANNPGT